MSFVDVTQAVGKSGWIVMYDKICGDKLCSEIESGSVKSFTSLIAYFQLPLKQISWGTASSDVTCTEGKSLV